MSLVDKRKRVPALFVGLGIPSMFLSVSAYAMTPAPLPQDEDAGEMQDDQEAMSDRARGEAALAEAEAHMEAGRWQAAADAYSAAINFLGDDEANRDLRIRAEAGLSDALSRFDEAGRLEDTAQEDELLAQRAMAEFDAAYENAVALLGQQQFREAHNTILTANIRLQSARIHLSEPQYTERADRAAELMGQIESAEEAFQLAESERIRRELEEQQIREEQEAREAREAQIHQLLLQVRDDQLERNYTEALNTIDHILFLDEGNPVALALRDAIQTAALWQSYMTTEREKDFTYAFHNEDNRRAALAPRPNRGPGAPRSTTGIMSYPEDWPTLSIMRTSAAGFLDNEANRSVAMALETVLPSVEFRNNRLAQVVDFLQTVTSVNIQPDWKNLSFIGVEQDDVVNLAMREVPVRTVLDQVLGQLGEDSISAPRYAIQDGLVVISSEEAIRQHVVTLVYDIRDLLFEVPYFDNAPTYDLQDILNQGAQLTASTRSQGAFSSNPYRAAASEDESFNGGGEFFRDPEEDPEKSREALIDKLVNVIQNNIDPDGWADFGGDTGRLTEINGNLVITQTPRNHQNIQGLLSQLREIRALQINIETRFLTVDMNWFEKIGFDLDLYFNTNDTAFDQAKAVDPLFHLGDFFTGNGRLKDPLIFDSFSQTNAFSNQIAFGNHFGVPTGTPPTDITYLTGPVGPPIRPTEGFSPINFQQDSFNLVDLLGGFGSDSFAATVLANNPALSVGIQFLDDVQVDLLIQATQADRRNVVLTAPRLTLFNGQRAWVQVGRQQAIVSQLIPVLGDASGAFTPILQTLPDGVVMDVEAVISADRRYVTLTIITGIVEIINIETLEFTGAAGGGGLVGGGASEFSGTISLPEVQVTQVNTSASVPDRGTLLIGGQRLIEEVEVEAGSPVFSKIPWINRFFTNRVTSKDESTLLILIRPEIIIQQENEDLLFPGLGDDLGGL